MSADLTTVEPGLPFYRRRSFWRNSAPVIAMVLAVVAGFAIFNAFDSTNGLGVESGPRINYKPPPPPPPNVKYDAATIKAQHAVILEFVKTAVAHKHLGQSYSLIGPGLREGIPKKKWETGYTTIIPYPVNAKTSLTYDKNVRGDYRYPTSMRQQVHVNTPGDPAETRKQPGNTFFAFLIKRDGRWLVNDWVSRWTPPIPTA